MLVSAFGEHAFTIAADPNPLAPARYAADLHVFPPRIDDPGYVPFLVELVSEHDVGARRGRPARPRRPHAQPLPHGGAPRRPAGDGAARRGRVRRELTASRAPRRRSAGAASTPRPGRSNCEPPGRTEYVNICDFVTGFTILYG
jgi:hypothetical protein